MYDLACKGEPWAQKEYALMLAKQERLRRTYADAFKGEDIDQVCISVMHTHTCVHTQQRDKDNKETKTHFSVCIH